MIKRSILVLGMLSLFANCAWALDVTDDRGVTQHFVNSPKRIVSILPSLTESVCALGQCQRLVGVDRYSNFPEQVRRLPQVGGNLDPNIEAIVALKPDVVLVSVATRASERLQALGIPVLAMEPKSQQDVRRILGKIAQLLEVDHAEQLWQSMTKGIEQAAMSVPARAKKMRVYFEVNNAPYAAGASSFIGETLTLLGVGNVVPPELGPFPKLNPEFIVRANPDLIMVGQRGFSAFESRPGWATIRAVREKRVCVFTPEQSDVLVRPGPRMAEAAQMMAACLRSKG